jgi:hypothetical protein
MSTTATGDGASTRRERAKREHMTYYVIGADQHVIEGDSGTRHVLDVDGTEALSCSCPDHQNRHRSCKHMIAYQEWYIDSVVMSCGIELDL